MPNVQQPEMRRSGRDPLVQDSAKQRAQAAPADRGGGGPIPEAQRSTYGPRRPKERTEEQEPQTRSTGSQPEARSTGGARRDQR